MSATTNTVDHSPGPWQLRERPDGSWVIVDRFNRHIGDISSRPILTWADARLIAVSPDLLEALRLYDIYDAMPSDRGGRNGPRGRAYQAFLDAKAAALSKATGSPAPQEKGR